jgi:hypothetical protein
MFWATDGMLIAHLSLSLRVGSIVALVDKGREMVATMTLALLLCAMVGAAYVTSLAKLWPLEGTFWWMLAQFASPFAIVVGGAIVRTRRSTATVRPSRA